MLLFKATDHSIRQSSEDVHLFRHTRNISVKHVREVCAELDQYLTSGRHAPSIIDGIVVEHPGWERMINIIKHCLAPKQDRGSAKQLLNEYFPPSTNSVVSTIVRGMRRATNSMGTALQTAFHHF